MDYNQMLAQAMMNQPAAPDVDQTAMQMNLMQGQNMLQRADQMRQPINTPYGMHGWGTTLASALRPLIANKQEKKATTKLAEALAQKGQLGQYQQQMESFDAEIQRIKELQDFDRKEKTKAGYKDERTTNQKDLESMGYQAGTPEYNRLMSERSRGVTVKTGNTPESAQEKANLAAIGKRTEYAVEENQALMDAGAEARQMLPQYDLGLSLLDKVETGPLTEKINHAKKLANTFGMDIDMSSVADFEQLSPIFGQFLFQGIQQTKGSVSDKEMEIFKRINANYAYTTEGNKRLLQYAKGRAERDIALRNLVRDLRRQGASPDDVSMAADQFIQEHDLSGDIADLGASSSGGSVTEGTIIENPSTGERLRLSNGQWIPLQ